MKESQQEKTQVHEELSKQLELLNMQIQRKDDTIQLKDNTIEEKEHELQQKDLEIQALRNNLERKEEKLCLSSQQVQSLQNDLTAKENALRLSSQQVQSLQNDLTAKENALRLSSQQVQSLQNDLTAKENAIRLSSQQVQSLQNDLTTKENALCLSSQQVRSLQNDLAEKETIIQRSEDTIADQQREIRQYRDNPHWLIQREEVEVTEEVLGKGGWGEVKVGIFRGTRVAVKCLHQEIVSEFYLELFSREMDIASRVRHPSLLQFIGATKVGNPIIVTELMPTSLRNELQKSPMARPQVISIGIDVASALNYLHLWKPQPILHRDVSSANVLLEQSTGCQWRAKVSDYGSANLLDKVRTEAPGSPVYSAPEATTPSLHSPAMDVYSFGILLVEMSIRRFPSAETIEKEAQIREVRWPQIKRLILCCTGKVNSRPKTEVVLTELKEMYRDDFNRY